MEKNAGETKSEKLKEAYASVNQVIARAAEKVGIDISKLGEELGELRFYYRLITLRIQDLIDAIEEARMTLSPSVYRVLRESVVEVAEPEAFKSLVEYLFR